MSSTYELARIQDEPGFYRKLRSKRIFSKWMGEPYIGRRVKLKYFRRWMAQLALPPNPSILEVGSGDGTFCFFLAKFMPQARIIGMELNPVEARVCDRLARQEGLDNLRFM